MSSTTNSASGSTIGYCHSCDRQVEIDRESFTCTQCHGGFIELFDMESRSSQQDPNRARAEAFGMNDANFANLLPMLLPHLLNPLQHNIRTNIMQQQQGQAQSQTPSQESGGSQPQAQSQQHSHAHVRQGPTRLQFIVPGEQVDLYGIINNVLSEVLDPSRAATGRPPQANFHFQSPPMRMFQLHGDLRDYAWGATGLDTIITQLLNQLENSGPPPASDDQLKNLPVIKISQEDVDNNVQCAICMEDFKLGDEAKKLPCRHLFHEPCISEWLKLHGTCPVCRKNLNGEDTSQREYITPANNANDANNAASTASSNPETTSNANSNSTASNTNNTNSNAGSGNYYEPDMD